MIRIEGIDGEDMMARLMCDEETCRIIIQTFSKDVGEKYKRLMIETDDERFVTLAHGIKGSCANISANECYKLAKTLELKARAQGRGACEEELAKLLEALGVLLKNIDDSLNGGDEDIFFLHL